MNTRPLRDIQAGNPYHALIGVELVESGEGYARCRLPVVEKLRGGVAGSVHGGVISSLVDIACLEAIVTTVKRGEQMAGTAELNVSYLRPALGTAIFATAHLLKKGRTLAVVDVEITNEDDKLLAKGRVTYALRPGDYPPDALS